MPFSSPIFEILFLFSVSIIWLMIIYQLILSFFGYLYRLRIEKQRWDIDQYHKKLPGVSLLIPARNEDVVLEKTLKHILSLDYPRQKMEVIVINDGSTDNTKSILDSMASQDERIKPLHLPVASRGRGKSHALNKGLEQATYDFIAVYDADNNPEVTSLKQLILHLIANNSLGAVIGKFRTQNKKKNLLTRFINIETLGFQWILQAGRYRAFGIAILPGTNCVIRKQVLMECGGWDESAITEDSELSVRIYQKGWKIQFVPTAETWEQEPEKLKIWIGQRTRWVRGNNYVIKKFFGQALKLKSRILSWEFLYLFVLYYVFLFAILISHSIFILSGLGIISIAAPGPYTAVWGSAFLLYILEIVLVLSFENEDSLLNILVTAFMYFTYCQLWIYVVFRSLFLDIFRKRVGIWDKTERTAQ